MTAEQMTAPTWEQYLKLENEIKELERREAEAEKGDLAKGHEWRDGFEARKRAPGADDVEWPPHKPLMMPGED